MKKTTKNKIEYFSFILFIKVFRIFPYPFSKSFIGNLFILGGMVFKFRKKVALNNLKMVFPEKTAKEMKIILKKMYFNMGITVAETYFLDSSELINKVETKGWENLERAVKMGKGVILASGHIGNWELAAKYIAANYKFAAVFKTQRNKLFDKYNNELRENCNVTLINMKKALRPILKYLKKNYIITILTDQNAGKNGVLTDFLGHNASTYVGAAKISVKTGCPIVPAYSIKRDDGTHLYFFEEMILPDDHENTLASIKDFTELISKSIEKYIIEYPSQWFWVHRRWRGYKKARKT